MLWSKEPDGRVRCALCGFRCSIADGKRGVCGVRENSGGTLQSLNYGKLIAANVDPIEKKPLFHFLPASSSYSIATVGCNFRCLHCQNSEISQMPREKHEIVGGEVTPGEVVADAEASGCRSIAYTYTEPTIFFEYARDCGVLARKKGLKNVFVTNGYMTRECLDEAKDFLDAANVDIKSFSDDFYKKVCGAHLAPVLDSIVRMRELGIWVEVTTLVIPGYNDSEEDLRAVARWMASVDKNMPWHVSAFFPAYKLKDAPATPRSTISMARRLGFSEGLKFVYAGNVPGDAGESTYCPKCREAVVDRRRYVVLGNNIKDSKCKFCGEAVEGVWR